MSQLKCLSILSLALATAMGHATVIDFGPLSGLNGDVYTGHSEDGYTVTPLSGDLREAHGFGSPVPALFTGPLFDPLPASVEIVRENGWLFTLDSADISSNTDAGSSYLFEGYYDGELVAWASGGFSLTNTFETKSGLAPILDRAVISLRPGDNATSMNLDNIVVTEAVPEPGTLAALGLGLAAAARRRKAA